MTSDNLLKLEKLALHNFRSFTECEIGLHQDLTVLVAENGLGKTAILDAIGVALASFVDAILFSQHKRGFASTDIQRIRADDGIMIVAPEVGISAEGIVNGKKVSWHRTLKASTSQSRPRTITKGAMRIQKEAHRFAIRAFSDKEEELGHPQSLPVICFYGTGRLWSEHRRTERRRGAAEMLGRLSGYSDCLSSSSSFKGFVEWYESIFNALRDPSSVAYGPEERPEKLLAAIREAVRVVLAPTGWRDLDWDFEQRLLVAEHPDHGRLPLSVLSDGVRNMIALVADLAYRCARLNPHFGEDAAQRTPGILLIDEIDMHLHPAWQQTVVASLRDAFPKVQFIVTTHSDLVVSTVPRECIRILGSNGSVSIPSEQTQGYDSPFALGIVFGVNSTPPIEIARKLSRYRALLEQGVADSEETRTLREQLMAHFGAQHPAMLAAEGIRRLQAFKARMAAKRGDD